MFSERNRTVIAKDCKANLFRKKMNRKINWDLAFGKKIKEKFEPTFEKKIRGEINFEYSRLFTM